MRPKLELAILAQLTRGDGEERFVFREGAEAILIAALEADLATPDPLASVTAALRFCAAFDGTLASPSSAALLREVVRKEPRALRLLKESVLDERPIDRMRNFVRSEGREVALNAPLFDQARRKGGHP